MKNIFRILILSSLPAVSMQAYSAPIPQVPDPGLQQCIYDHAMENNWQTAEEFTFLHCANNKVSDIVGIELLPYLNDIDLSFNRLQDVTPLSAYTQLSTLNLSHNIELDLFSIIPVIHQNRQLRTLSLAGIEIDDLSMLPLVEPSTQQNLNLQVLDLHDTGLKTASNLNQFPNLEVINFANNQLEGHLDLYHHQQLRHLDIANNDIDDIVLAFDTHTLESLKVSGNLRLAKHDIFSIISQSPNIREIGIAGFQLNDLTELPLSAITNLDLLDVRNTGIKDIDALQQFPGLRHLNIGDNPISDLQPLGQLQQLQTVSANNLGASNIPLVSTQLESLHISGNNIPLYEVQSILANNWNLQNVSIAGVKFQSLNELPLLNPTTNQFYKLRSLDISSTQIDSLFGIENFPELRVLKANDNQLTDIYGIEPLEKLQEIHVGDNQLVTVWQLNQMENLRALNLSNNARLSTENIIPIIAGNRHLQHVELEGFRIDDINILPFYDSEKQKPYNLKTLNLSHTNLEHLYGIEQFIDLESLDLSHNRIEDIGPIQLLPQIRRFDISFNRLDHFPPTIHMENIIALDVGGNALSIDEVMPIIHQAHRLQELGISGIKINGLEELPLYDSLNAQAYALQRLDVSNTGIDSIDRLYEFPNLHSLNISDNRIQDLTPLSASTRLNTLLADNNHIETLIHLENIRSLEVLHLDNNSQLSESDLISIISNNPQLVDLSIAGISINSFENLNIQSPSPSLPYQLQHLDISDTGIKDLFPVVQHQNLKTLRADNNGIYDIAMLEQLHSLAELTLSHNHIETVWPLEQTNNLTRLDLSYNSKLDINQVIPVIANNFMLKHLALNGIRINDFNMLPLYDAYTQSHYPLESLHLGHTGLDHAYGVENFSLLKSLDLSHNNLHSLPNIDVLTNLEALYINNNHIVDLQPWLQLQHLEELDVSYNSALDIDQVNMIISQNPRLHSLGVAGFNLISVDDLALFYPQTNRYYALQKLNISHTGVNNIDALANFRHLREINLKGNMVQNLMPLQQLDSLQHIVLAENPIDDLTPLFHLSGLTTLDASFINAEKYQVFNLIDNNPQLKHLGIAGIQLVDLLELPLFSFNPNQPTAIKTLNVASTGLTNTYGLEYFPRLVSLDLSQNAIAHLTGIQEALNLENLYVQYNNLSHVQELNNLQHLKILNLEGNPTLSLEDIFPVIAQNTELRELYLSDMNIPSLDSLPIYNNFTQEPYALESLTLRNTGLMNLSTIHQFQTLKYVDFSFNEFDYILGLINVASLETANLLGNPQISCEQLDTLELHLGTENLIRPNTCQNGSVPNLMLISPVNGSAAEESESILLSATADDAEDGDLSDTITWSSNLSGHLGLGATVNVILPPGVHVITASVTDSAGNLRTSVTTLTVIESSEPAYCSSQGNSTSYEWIDAISINMIEMFSGSNNGYGDFSQNSPIILSPGSNTLTLTPGYRSSSYYERWNIWIDLNRDGQFDQSELLVSEYGRNAINTNLPIPSNISPGLTTLIRVSMAWGSAPSPCGSFNWGEVEDYRVTIQ